MGRRRTLDTSPVQWRIGEVTKLTGVTCRTLRYWEEQGLLQPASQGTRGDRLYSATDIARVGRIRDLQELLGFSLAEVHAVLDTEDVDVLDRVRSELRGKDPGPTRRKELLDQAIIANEQLLARLRETLACIQNFYDERAEATDRLNQALAELEHESPGEAAAESAPPLRTTKKGIHT